MLKILVGLYLGMISFACASDRELVTAPFVNVQQYLGKWYAISALKMFATRDCISQTAEYGSRDESSITVLNTCYKQNKVTTISGKATIRNKVTNAELVVEFDNFFTKLFRVKGDYNIIKLDSEYKYVLVGSRDRKSLWIMSRTDGMPEKSYTEYVEFAKIQGFPVDELVLSRFKTEADN